MERNIWYSMILFGLVVCSFMHQCFFQSIAYILARFEDLSLLAANLGCTL